MSFPEKMTVWQYTSRLKNGAGIAALRLHDGLRKMDVDSILHFGEGANSDSSNKQIYRKDGFKNDLITRLHTGLQTRVQAEGGDIRNPKWWVKAKPLEGSPEIVHIHSLFRWVDLLSFFQQIPEHTPIVWSLHDFEPISGGCIYPGACSGLENHCDACPQMRSGYSWITTKNHKIKKVLFGRRSVHFVSNSSWTLDQTEKSSLGKLGASRSMIHLGLDIDQYRPINKITAREGLCLPETKVIIGFAATDLQEQRKGLSILMAALKKLHNTQFTLLSFGNGAACIHPNHIHLGPIYSTSLQRLFYSSLDLFVTPSLLETFGNTAMEAMACGTPVAAYNTSGLKDVVGSGSTGILVDPIGDCDALALALAEIISNPAICQEMGINARKRVVEKFDVKIMATKYQNLYEKLISEISK